MEEIDKKINEADTSAKAKQKAYADHRRGAISPIFHLQSARSSPSPTT